MAAAVSLLMLAGGSLFVGWLLLMVVVGSAVGYAVVVYPSQGVVMLPGAASAPLGLLRRSCVVVRLA